MNEIKVPVTNNPGPVVKPKDKKKPVKGFGNVQTLAFNITKSKPGIQK